MTDPAIRKTLKPQQSGEDRVAVAVWFTGLCNGTYFEMGALDGVVFRKFAFL